MENTSGSNILFLVDFKEKKFKKIGTLPNPVFIDGDGHPRLIPNPTFKEYIKSYTLDLKDGLWLFVARFEDGQYQAEYRVTYASWAFDETEDEDILAMREYPYFIDIAESDEGREFSKVVNYGELYHSEMPKKFSVEGKVRVFEQTFLNNKWEEGLVSIDKVNNEENELEFEISSELLARYKGKRVKITIEEV